MYTIVNRANNQTHNFTKVHSAVVYLKTLQRKPEPPTKDEIIDLCNIFAKYKNKIAIL